jgi:multiple sugar transport system permease protein
VTVRREDRAAYLLLAPWLVGLVVLTAGPILASLYLSMTDFDLLTPPRWAGWDNYRRLASDPHYTTAVKVTFIYVVVSVPLVIGFALLVAAALAGRGRGAGAYRAAYYLPSLLGGSVAVSIMWRQIFGADGLINKILGLVGVHGPSWISTPQYAIYTLIALHIWQFGSPMLIFLAGLKQIPAELYEAAAVDGAGPTRRFLRLTLPLLTPLIFFNLVLQMITRSRRSPPPSSSPAAKAAPPTRRCSTRCPSTRKGSRTSGWATPPRWPGPCSPSSPSSPPPCSPPPATGSSTPTGTAPCEAGRHASAAHRRGADHAVPAPVDDLRLPQADRRDLRRRRTAATPGHLDNYTASPPPASAADRSTDRPMAAGAVRLIGHVVLDGRTTVSETDNPRIQCRIEVLCE